MENKLRLQMPYKHFLFSSTLLEQVMEKNLDITVDNSAKPYAQWASVKKKNQC